MEKNMTEKEITFDSRGTHGVVHMYFILRKPLGVVVLMNMIHDNDFHPMTLDYHSKTENPRLTGHTEHCEYLDQECYHDGSGMAAKAAWEAMETSGTHGLWQELEEFYYHNTGRD